LKRSQEAQHRFESIRAALDAVTNWTHDPLRAAIEQLAESHGEKLGAYVHPLRLALTGKSVGPGLFELTELLGGPTTLARLDKATFYIRQIPL
jgi:glutamyl-tRNA synthetase